MLQFESNLAKPIGCAEIVPHLYNLYPSIDTFVEKATTTNLKRCNDLRGGTDSSTQQATTYNV